MISSSTLRVMYQFSLSRISLKEITKRYISTPVNKMIKNRYTSKPVLSISKPVLLFYIPCKIYVVYICTIYLYIYNNLITNTSLLQKCAFHLKLVYL